MNLKQWRKSIVSMALALMMLVLPIGTFTGATKRAHAAKATAKTDFYEYVNRDWFKKNKLKPDEASVNNFSILRKQTEKNIKKILKNLDKNYDKLQEGSDEKKLIDFYREAKDFKTRDQLGFKPVKEYIDAIKAVSNIKEMNNVATNLSKKNYVTGLVMGAEVDRKNSNKNILYVSVPYVGLDKFYFDGKDEYALTIQKAYKTYMEEVFALNGNSKDEAKKKANLVFDFEKKLVSSYLSQEEASDIEKQYHIMTVPQIKKLVSNLDFETMLKTLGFDKAEKIVVMQPKALEMLNKMYTSDNLPALKAQLEFQVINSNALCLSKDLIKAATKYDKAFSGVYKLDSDEELAYKALNGIFGELLGKVYVENYFSEETKQDVLNMIEEIHKVYKKRIKAAKWLSDATKKKAIKKINTMVKKVGYPDKWTDFSKADIKTYEQEGNLVSNTEQIIAVYNAKTRERLNKTPDRTEWSLTPQEVNAYYNPQNNEIVFPAAVFQAPLYDVKADKESNLGGIGAIIGHETSHAFDDNGALFDEKGNLVNWWNKKDYKAFKVKVKKAADIFSAIEVVPGYHVNGEISTGEIIADLGGLTVAIDVAKEKGYDTKKVFEAYGKVWRDIKTKEALIGNLTDVHPPGKYRVNNIVNLLDQFYKDFDIKETDPMYVKPEDRLQVW